MLAWILTIKLVARMSLPSASREDPLRGKWRQALKAQGPRHVTPAVSASLWGPCCHSGGPRGQSTEPKRIILSLKIWWNLPCWVLDLLGICLPFVLFLSFEMGMSILCLLHHYILEADNLSGFTASQLERDFCLRISHTYLKCHV